MSRGVYQRRFHRMHDFELRSKNLHPFYDNVILLKISSTTLLREMVMHDRGIRRIVAIEVSISHSGSKLSYCARSGI